MPITVFVVGPTGPIIAQAGDPEAGEMYARWVAWGEVDQREMEDTSAWLSKQWDREEWLEAQS